MPRERFELSQVAPPAPKAGASANSATSATFDCFIFNPFTPKSKTKAGFRPREKLMKAAYCATCKTSAMIPRANSATMIPMPAYIIRLRAEVIFSVSPAAVMKV